MKPLRRLGLFGAVGSAVLALAGQTFAAGTVIYDSIPNPTAGNYPSQPFQAQQASEFGDRIAFAAGPRQLREVTVLMSSWACQNGAWFSNDCATTPGATFAHPITINVYAVGIGNAVGALLGSTTATVNIPYRPSASPSCPGGTWSDGTSCFNGYAAPITIDMSSLGLTLPNQVIVGIAYNTSNYGANPIGVQPCSATPEGCPYDSLNVALVDPAANPGMIGVNPAPSDAYFDTETAAWYCDGGACGTGTFRLDAGCWTGFKPALRVTASFATPTTADQCKKNGWMTRSRADGSSFKNQGDCIQYVNTGK